ncbi:MAG: LuxR C-terminal-related transcriptional regulator [Mycobacteriales bacterium]
MLAPAPLCRPHLPRPRLYELLDAVDGAGVGLIIAPAGAGKTTLLAGWPAAGVAAWMRLGHADADPAVLWRHLRAALCRAGLDVPAGGAAALADAVAAHRGLVTVILDDLHRLDRDPGPLAELLGFLPPNLRLVMASRTTPAVPLGRLRAAGALVEVDGDALAFRRDEARALLDALHLTLTGRELDELLCRTEGWAAGLRLAADWITAGNELRRTPADLGGEVFAEFLTQEVLDPLPDSDRELLAATSLTERVDAALASALTGRPDADTALARLARHTGFVRPGYRYHPLLREVLANRLSGGRRRELHRAAARHFASGPQRDPAAAVRHAVHGEDWEYSARLLTDSWLELAASGQAEVLAVACAAVPEERTRHDPSLALAFAAHHLLSDGDVGTAEVYLARAERHPLEQPRLAATHATIRLYQARLRGDFSAAVAPAGRALELARGDVDAPVRLREARLTGLLAALGTGQQWAGDLAGAEASLLEALTTASGQPLAEAACRVQLAVAYARLGRLRRALQESAAAGEIAGRHGLSSTVPLGGAHLARALVHAEREQPAAAARWLDVAETALRAVPEPAALALATLTRARLVARDGDRAGALDLVGAVLVTRPPVDAALLRHARMLEARLRLDGDDQAGARAALAAGLAHEVPGVDTAATVAARLLLAADDPAAALTELEPVLALPAPAAPLDVLVYAWLTAAVAHRRLRAAGRVEECLDRALRLAAPEDLIGVFVAGGPEVRGLLIGHTSASGEHAAFRHRLLAAFEQRATAVRAVEQPLEPLTDRELTVLRYLPTLMGTGEIAADLYVSVNTVKTHLKNIYRKLNASSRREAVSKARQYQLL